MKSVIDIFSPEGLQAISRYVMPETVFVFNLDSLASASGSNSTPTDINESIRSILEKLSHLGKVAAITRNPSVSTVDLLGFEPLFSLGSSQPAADESGFAKALQSNGIYRAVLFGDGIVDAALIAVKGFDILGIHTGDPAECATRYYLNRHTALLGLLNSIAGILETDRLVAHDT